jgi:hypothetical protein
MRSATASISSSPSSGGSSPSSRAYPWAITEVALGPPRDRERARANLVSGIAAEVSVAEQAGFDLDEVTAAELEEPERPPALYGLGDLGVLLTKPELLPHGIESKPLGTRDRSYLAPGMSTPVRVTTDPDYFEQHPDSTELWSPGSPLFPKPETVAEVEEVVGLDWRGMVASPGGTQPALSIEPP